MKIRYTNFSRYFFYGLSAFLLGALFLSAFSVPQKIVLGASAWTLKGYIVPVLFGGSAGAIIGLWYLRLKLYAQEALQSEERFRTMADYTYDWEYWIDRQGQYVYMTPSCEGITGYSASEFMQNPDLLAEIIHPDDRESVVQHFHKELESDEIVSLDFRIITRDGQTCWIEHKCQPVYSADGRHLGRRASDRDITQWMNAKNALQESEQTLRGIVDEALDGITLVNEDGIVVEWNKSQEKITGLGKEDIIGQPVWDVQQRLRLPERRSQQRYEQTKTLLEQFFKTGEPPWGNPIQEVTIHRVDGARRTIQQVPFPIKTEKGPMLGSITRDITDRAQAEKAEREQRLLAETLQEVTLALTAHVSHRAVLDEILNQIQRLVPYSTANITLLKDNVLRVAHWRGYEAFNAAEMIDSLTQPLSSVPVDAEIVETRQPLLISDTHREPNWVVYQETAWIRSHITVPLCHQDRILGVLRLDSDEPNKFSYEDIRRLEPLANAASIALENARLYEQALQDARTKATLLREVNHRVKNNLSAIIGLLYAERRHAGVENRPAYQAIIQDLITRVRGLATVHTLLSASEWQPLNLSYLVNQVIHATLQTLPRRMEVIVNVPSSQLQVTPRQANSLALVINELATNAVKYALPGQDTCRIDVTITTEDKQLCLEFRDDGPGYPDDVMQLESRNIGLYLINNIVENELRGQINIDNDKGAVVTITFKHEMGETPDGTTS